MADSFSAQLGNVTRKFAELDTRMDEFCSRIDDNDSATRIRAHTIPDLSQSGSYHNLR